MIKIKECRVNKKALIGLPQIWLDDTKLKPGDRVVMYRDENDQLILVAARPRREVQK